jgi:hypothetical protein
MEYLAIFGGPQQMSARSFEALAIEPANATVKARFREAGNILE